MEGLKFMDEIKDDITKTDNKQLDLNNLMADFPGGVVYFQFNEKMTIEYYTNSLLGMLECDDKNFNNLYKGSFKSIVHKDDFEQVYNCITETISEGKSSNVECRLVLRGNKTRWVSMKFIIKGNKLTKLRVIANIIDIDSYKEKEIRAGLEKEKYRQILNMNSNIYFELLNQILMFAV